MIPAGAVPCRLAPLVLVALAHAALAWGLWNAALSLPAAAAGAAPMWLVVQARLVPAAQTEPLPPPRRAAAPRTGALPTPSGPAHSDSVAAPQAAPAPPPPADLQAVAALPAAAEMAAPAPPAPAPPAQAPPTRRHSAPDHSGCARAPYPLPLQERGIEGTLRLRVHVAADGRATQVLLLASSGFRLFDEAALAQARGCRFRPARLGEEAVDEWVEYPVRFSLQG